MKDAEGDAMKEDSTRAAIMRRGKRGLLVAATAITVISLWGPLALAAGGGFGVALSFAPLLWLVAIGGLLVWFRSYRSLKRPRHAEE
jgi:hypothetical protein